MRPLVVGGNEIGGIGYREGQLGDARQDAVRGIFALPSDNGNRAEFGDVILDVCDVRRRKKETMIKILTHPELRLGTGGRTAPWGP